MMSLVDDTKYTSIGTLASTSFDHTMAEDEATDCPFPVSCQICNDRATGRHYGATSCDGCKGFFRRTVRKGQLYTCRFDRNCLIDKDKRNTCRFCRYEKCLKAGMRKQAVQSERDRIYARKSRSTTSASSTTPTNVVSSPQSVVGNRLPSTTTSATCPTVAGSSTLSSALKMAPLPKPVPVPAVRQLSHAADQLEALKQAENLLLASTSLQSPINSPPACSPAVPATSFGDPLASAVINQEIRRLATLADLADAIKEQLLLLVEWAKTLRPFMQLTIDDQVALLRGYAAEHLLLGVARRSLPFKDVLLLSNHAYIPREHASEIHDVKHVVFHILDDLVAPMRELQLDMVENGCLKALLFFNPNARGLSNKLKVKEARQGFLEAFCEYVTKERSQKDKVRFGNLLLLLPPLPSMSQQFIEDLQLATLFGKIEFDKLLEELLLATAPAPILADGFNPMTRKMAEVPQEAEMIDVVTTDVPSI